MHGLFYRAIRGFVIEVHGAEVWQGLMTRLGKEDTSFHLFGAEHEDFLDQIIEETSAIDGKTPGEWMEDLGHWLVSAPGNATISRLLHFGGRDFSDFLYSLEELADRVELALPGVNLPEIDVLTTYSGTFRLKIKGARVGFGSLLVGLIRSMSDDFGCLSMVEFIGREGEDESLRVELLDLGHAEGRVVSLGEVGGLS